MKKINPKDSVRSKKNNVANGEFAEAQIQRDETGVLLAALMNDIGSELEVQDKENIWKALQDQSKD
jgi:hypothetical protein|tara:strand:- start:1039 stop:1236 length:198 start_codon:yes stop_codon:yes gene_type:complete